MQSVCKKRPTPVPTKPRSLGPTQMSKMSTFFPHTHPKVQPVPHATSDCFWFEAETGTAEMIIDWEFTKSHISELRDLSPSGYRKNLENGWGDWKPIVPRGEECLNGTWKYKGDAELFVFSLHPTVFRNGTHFVSVQSELFIIDKIDKGQTTHSNKTVSQCFINNWIQLTVLPPEFGTKMGQSLINTKAWPVEVLTHGQHIQQE